MGEIKVELTHQDIERLELQAQAQILAELDARQMESGGNWLLVWNDLNTEVNQLLRKVSA